MCSSTRPPRAVTVRVRPMPRRRSTGRSPTPSSRRGWGFRHRAFAAGAQLACGPAHGPRLTGGAMAARLLLGAAAAGAISMYLLDPDHGRRRRAVMRDRVASGIARLDDAT